MAVFFRVGLLVAAMLLSACGSEDAPRPGQRVSSGVEVPPRTPPQPDTPPPPGLEPPPGGSSDDGRGGLPSDPGFPDDSAPQPPGEEPGPEDPAEEPADPAEPGDEPGEPTLPAPGRLETNVFFPVQPGIGWYFDNNPEPFMLGTPWEEGTETVWPLEHSDILSGFFTSTADQVGLKGVRVLLLQQADPVYLAIHFATTRPVLGSTSSLESNGATTLDAGPLGSLAVPVRLTATRTDREWIGIPGLGPQPAQRVAVTLRLGFGWLERQLILGTAPWLAPAFEPVSFELLFVPGVGLVGAGLNETTSQVQGVIAIPAPVVFATSPHRIPAPQQLLLNGAPLTDLDWVPTILYGTAEQHWLDVQFDGSGSWFAHLTRTLPRGIHAATVRFRHGTDAQDVTVSVMVE